MSREEKTLVRDLIESVIIAVVLAFGITRPFIIQPFAIPSGSMEPTLLVGDKLFVNKFIYRFKPIHRFDVIVFKYPQNPKVDYIKRVIALEGETVQLIDGKVYINGQPIEENHKMYPSYDNFGPVKVPQGHLFVLGDNRGNSEDSRYFGFVPVQNVLGKAFLIYWPPGRIGIIR
jgi:signal peptidase I